MRKNEDIIREFMEEVMDVSDDAPSEELALECIDAVIEEMNIRVNPAKFSVVKTAAVGNYMLSWTISDDGDVMVSGEVYGATVQHVADRLCITLGFPES